MLITCNTCPRQLACAAAKGTKRLDALVCAFGWRLMAGRYWCGGCVVHATTGDPTDEIGRRHRQVVA